MEKYTIVLDGSVEGKPRACAFAGDAIGAGVSAAHMQGFAVVVPPTEEMIALAKEIPVGRVTSAGKVACSFVKQETYAKFAALVGTGHELQPADTSGGHHLLVSKSAPPLELWSSIGVGATVLATVGREDGWWEAVVLAADPASERLTLSWRDWPNMPSFGASRRSVALTAPSA